MKKVTSYSQADENRLWSNYRSSRGESKIVARNALIELYRGILIWCALRVFKTLPQPKPCEIDELVNEAIPHMIKLLERFDSSKGITFFTFASYRIHGSMLDFLRDSDWAPRTVIRKNIREAEGAETIKRQISLSAWKRGEVDYQSSPLNDQGFTDDPGRVERADWWKAALKGLKQREKLILLLYFREEMPMSKVAKSFGLRESRISQIISAAIDRIRSRSDMAAIA